MPFVSPDPGVQVQTNKDADLTAKKAGDLALAKIDLFTNNITPGPLSVIGDFTVPTWTGYVQKAVAGWTANDPQPDGSVTTTATTVLTWVGPVDATGQTVYGYLIRSAAGGTPLIQATRFDAPVGIVDAGDVLNLVPSYRTK